jgi:UDP-glucuronate 4-epimerase
MAGFIGFHLSDKLACEGHQLLGIDNLNDYYTPRLKFDRLAALGIVPGSEEELVKSTIRENISFALGDIANFNFVDRIVSTYSPDLIIHLAAQAGVRYSIERPEAYIRTNLNGFFHIIEASRNHNIKRLVYASSSSVYGNQEEVPFKETDKTDNPVSLYAATKKSNELMAETYSHLFGIKAIGLRFFTVYGPYGRPDMAYFSFVKNIIEGNPIRVFNSGNLSRDFTYIKDIITSISLLVKSFDEIALQANHQIFNIGNSSPVSLMDFISTIEKVLDKKASIENVGMQSGDVLNTYADVSKLIELIGFKPHTSLEEGISAFANWYKKYYE